MEPPAGEELFRAVLSHFPTGVAVVTAVAGETPVGLTIQAFCSLSLDPPLVLICPALTSTSWPRIAAVGKLCVNLLAEDQEPLARQFARSGADKFADVEWTPSPVSGSPVLADTIAWIDCEVAGTHEGGDHLIVVCRVRDLRARPDRRPLIFYRSGFPRIA